MFWIVYALLLCALVFAALRIGKKMRESKKYNYRRGEGAIFFENGDLVLNGFPIQYAPVDSIEYVEFSYDNRLVEHGLRYRFSMKIFCRDKTATKTVHYQSFAYGNRVLRPRDVAKALEAKGIRCVLPTANV